MLYQSTRGQAPKLPFCGILMSGLAEDGGLYVPEQCPRFSEDDLNAMRGMSYSDLAFRVLSAFIGDIEPEQIKALAEKSYRPEVFCYARKPEDCADITPVYALGQSGLHLQSLSNGPTLAFKDLAMQFLGHAFEFVLSQNKRQVNILGATSGDTGSSAEYAMKGKSGIRVFMLSPHQRMSDFQIAQMFSLQDENIHNLSIRGVFDQCQDIVKAVSNDLSFKQRYRIAAVNSINWGRIAAQVVYYFKAYFAVTSQQQQSCSFTVPSGNFGNAYAGHIAKQMGLPIQKIIVATNENDVLNEFFQTGVYRPRPMANVHQTSSPSMDISKASNFERFAYDLSGRNPEVVREIWQKINQGEAVDFKDLGLFEQVEAYGFGSGSSTHQDRMMSIREVHEQYAHIIDTHTADAYKVAKQHRENDVPMVIMETAQATKFDDSIREALNQKSPRPEGLKDLELKPQRFTVLDADVNQVKDYLRQCID